MDSRFPNKPILVRPSEGEQRQLMCRARGVAKACAVIGVFAAALAGWGSGHAALGPGPVHAGSPRAVTNSVTHGTVVIDGHKISYAATAGTITLRNNKGLPTGSMFYVAYVKNGVANESRRPVTFFYNGGPGSSTVWLHMGAYGPKRVVTADHAQTPAAPYKLVNNGYSLLNVTDEVFIDAMSTGYSRIIDHSQGGVGTASDFYGVDPDARSFAQFIERYLTLNGRWNSPKYLYGESYGTLRSEVLVNYLEQMDNMDVNGVILQSAYMGYAIPSGDALCATDLPSFAADAWYHHALSPEPQNLPSFLQQVEHFAMGPYSIAMNYDRSLSPAEYNDIADKVHQYIGIPVDYIKKANLCVTIGEFTHELLASKGETIGTLDARFAGPSMDLLSKNSQTDPQYSSIDSAYVTAFNEYIHKTLHYDTDMKYRPTFYTGGSAANGGLYPWPNNDKNLMTGQNIKIVNGDVDLAQALKYDPKLQVMVAQGYFDLSTPFYRMVYAINHMNVPRSLLSHVHYFRYYSGHMIYVHIQSLKKLHTDVTNFIKSTDNVP